jgi:hypothetical protein
VAAGGGGSVRKDGQRGEEGVTASKENGNLTTADGRAVEDGKYQTGQVVEQLRQESQVAARKPPKLCKELDPSREGHVGNVERSAGLGLQLVGQVGHPGSSCRHTASWQCLEEAKQGSVLAASSKAGTEAYDAASNYVIEARRGGSGRSGEGGLGGGGSGSAGSVDSTLGGGGSTASTAFKQALQGRVGKKEKMDEARQGGGGLRRRLANDEAKHAKRRRSPAASRGQGGSKEEVRQQEARQGGGERALRRRTDSSASQALRGAGRQDEARQGGYEDLRRRVSEGVHPEGPSGRGDDGPLGPEHEGRLSAEAGPAAPRPWRPTALCAVKRI